MKYKVTIVAFVEALDYRDAVDYTNYRLTGRLHRQSDNQVIPTVKPVRIDARLEGETE